MIRYKKPKAEMVRSMAAFFVMCNDANKNCPLRRGLAAWNNIAHVTITDDQPNVIRVRGKGATLNEQQNNVMICFKYASFLCGLCSLEPSQKQKQR